MLAPRHLLLLALHLTVAATADAGENLVRDPSFEEPREKDRFGRVFAKWAGWIYEGECEFRVADVAHTGKHSVLLVGGNAPKIRIWPDKFVLEPGRYRITAYLRGLDIGFGPYEQTTEFMFEGKYIPLKKNGTFGWSKLTYVGDVAQKREYAHPSFGLMAPGYLWVDDVQVEKVGPEVALTPVPVIGPEEEPIAPPGPIGMEVARCPECGYRNNASWNRCYACGTALGAKKAATGPAVKLITSFEEKNPFDGGTLVKEHATDGTQALRLDRNYAALEAPQDWAGYDYLKADVFNPGQEPLELTIEVRDKQTRDYWTRVNYTTVVPPGASTLVVPTALYVGEKSRPGRALQLDAVTRLVFAIGEKPAAPLFFDKLRLERDTATAQVMFDGLWAFDVGPAGSPVMEGFLPLDVSKTYTAGRGYGWKNTRFWRAFDALQPDPLYRDFLCIEKGGLALDVPNGKYHVFVNMDSPSGYWGEYQRYRRRALILEGQRYEDQLDLASFKKRYYRFADTEDLPGDNTFDKYQLPYFREKQQTVEVRDGQLNIEFEGENWACCVSALIVYPDRKAAEGQRFLDFVRERRRFHFDNAFKRILPPPTGQPVQPTEAELKRGFVLFQRDPMKDVNLHDRPVKGERVATLTGSAFAGEYEPITLSLLPLQKLEMARLTVSDLHGPGGAVISTGAIDVGHVRHRLARVTMEGSVYTISPRHLISGESAPLPPDITRTFWLTVKVPAATPPGEYQGEVRLQTATGAQAVLPLRFTVRKGTLDPVDIPAGPFGHTIDLPWYDEETASWNQAIAERSLRKLREYGFTTASGLPIVSYRGSKGGVLQLDFSRGDAQIRMFRANGFHMPVVTYCPFPGLNTYYKDLEAMKAAGFSNYSTFVHSVFSAVQRHATEASWLPVYWNIGDEPLGDDLVRAGENAEAYRQAFPHGPPFFAAATSFRGTNTTAPNFRFSKALHVAEWNEHDRAGVKLLQSAGGEWAFYNGGNRWTYGVYMYKAAKEYGMKFRLSWHWNVVAGDPYYPLDCREDDYAWCNSTPDGELVPSLEFERLRQGLGDYRRLLTLTRLAHEKRGTPAARDARRLMAALLGGFHLGDRDLKGVPSFTALRDRLDAALERLR